jgi:hypothetical protein
LSIWREESSALTAIWIWKLEHSENRVFHCCDGTIASRELLHQGKKKKKGRFFGYYATKNAPELVSQQLSDC